MRMVFLGFGLLPIKRCPRTPYLIPSFTLKSLIDEGCGIVGVVGKNNKN